MRIPFEAIAVFATQALFAIVAGAAEPATPAALPTVELPAATLARATPDTRVLDCRRPRSVRPRPPTPPPVVPPGCRASPLAPIVPCCAAVPADPPVCAVAPSESPAASDALLGAQRAASSAQDAARSAAVALAAARAASEAASRERSDRKASKLGYRHGDQEMSIESDNPWLLGVGAVCIAVPILAAVGLAIFAVVRKKEGGDGLPAAFYAAVAAFALLLVVGIWMVAHAGPSVATRAVATTFDPGPDPGPAWDGVLQDPASARLREALIALEHRLAGLPPAVVAAPPSDSGAIGTVGAVLGAFAAGLALAALALQLARPRFARDAAGADDGTSPDHPTPRAAEAARLTRQAQLELDRWLDDDDGDAAPQRAALDTRSLGTLLEALATLLRTVHPEHPEFVFPPRAEPVDASVDASAEDALRRSLRQVDRALDAGASLASRPDPERLETAMRALRRALVRKPPTKPRLGPGLQRGGAP